MNEQEQSAATIETGKPEEKSESELESRPTIKRGGIGRFVCPICQEKWHPRKYRSLHEFVVAHSEEHPKASLQYRDFVVKEFSSS